MTDGVLAALDHDVARAYRAWCAWRDGIAEDPAGGGGAPLGDFRHVAGKRAYDAVRALEPLVVEKLWRDAIARWIGALTQHRVTSDLDLQWEVAAHEQEAALHTPTPRRISWREAWSGLVAAGNRADADAHVDAASERGKALAAVARERAARRAEVAGQLMLAAGPPGVAREVARKAARALLARTEDLAVEIRREDQRRLEISRWCAADAIRAALARDAPEGWPARPTGAWFDEVFRGIAKGMKLRARLPRPYGAASFARALYVFGRRLRTAEPSSSIPFALATEPCFVDAARYGLTFAHLTLSPHFYRKALKTSARVASGQARALARAALFEARSIAVRALLTDDADYAPAPDFEELTLALFGAPLPASLRGAWPPPHGDETTRLVALLTTPPFARELVERFDVDWFANPRAALFLRGRASGFALQAEAELEPELAAGQVAAFLEGVLG